MVGAPMPVPAAPRRLTFAPRALVVLGGLPGAGKTTLLERLGGVPGAVVLDSAGATARWRRLPVPYRALRPFAHLEHHARIALAVVTAPGGVVVHETATRAASRRWLLALARLARRPAHLVLLDVDPATARAGQVARARVVPAASQARHARRWRALRAAAADGRIAHEPWASVRLLSRTAAGALDEVALAPPAPAPAPVPVPAAVAVRSARVAA